MSVQQTSEIRELTAVELDAVFGGVNLSDYGWSTFDTVIFSGAIGVVVGGIVGWIADLFD